MTMILTSPAFTDGDRIPDLYGCDGADISPPLNWSGAPEEARSFALLCDDPDAPDGTWTHWAIFDIAADASGLPEDYPKDSRVGEVRQAVTDFRRPGYGGPCPPRGHGLHHYNFRVLALDVERLDVLADATFQDVAVAAKAHTLDKADLTGTYSRDG
jgi:Raf kinase inhibitor-like YbhB/YbcL family protein